MNMCLAPSKPQLWHPCTPMKDLHDIPPLQINHAKGSYLFLQDGTRIIDANSSWWCKHIGHQHPKLQQALMAQAQKYEHVIAANSHSQILETLVERLAQYSPLLNKASFASDGSCAIEMALKMSLHAQHIQGQLQRTRFMALSHGYHGETGLALSVSEIPLYRANYQSILLDVPYIDNIPYVTSTQDPLWSDSATHWPHIEAQLLIHADHLAAIIVEPIVQAAGGMRIYSRDFLKRLQQFAQAHGIYLIADEIFTGLGRVGLPFAYQYASITPDFLCLGKGLTGGYIPMSVMLTTQDIYDLFDVDYDPLRTFFHSHTYSGNALAAAVAVATLQVLEEENIYARVQQQEQAWAKLMTEVAAETGCIQNIRHLGAVVAADLNPAQSELPRPGFAVFKEAIQRGAWLRPLGNTLYWCPPLNTSLETMQELRDITISAIQAVFH